MYKHLLYVRITKVYLIEDAIPGLNCWNRIKVKVHLFDIAPSIRSSAVQWRFTHYPQQESHPTLVWDITLKWFGTTAALFKRIFVVLSYVSAGPNFTPWYGEASWIKTDMPKSAPPTALDPTWHPGMTGNRTRVPGVAGQRAIHCAIGAHLRKNHWTGVPLGCVN